MNTLAKSTPRPLSGPVLPEPLALFRKAERGVNQSDLHFITAYGLTAWAFESQVEWSDALLPWDNSLPIAVRAAIASDVASGLSVKWDYLLPFRHQGRIILVAILPADPGEHVIAVPAPPPQRQPLVIEQSRPIYRDPPIPFPVLGVVPEKTRTAHVSLVNRILQGDRQNLDAALTQIMSEMILAGSLTPSEFFYYAQFMRAFISGSWVSIQEFFGLAELEEIIRQHRLSRRVAQEAAHAHLVEGKRLTVSPAK